MLFDRLDLFLDETPRNGALNMALDEMILRAVESPSLRVYRWAVPSVSFGYFGRYREVSARWPGRELVRRWTGGGEVPHGEDFTYTLMVPAAHSFARCAVRESYRAVHLALAELLPGASLAAVDEGDAPACFAHPVVADVLVAGRKVAGAAQRRSRHGLLHQGSVQGVTWSDDLVFRLAARLSEQVFSPIIPATLLAAAAELASAKYSTPSWLERR